MKLTTTFWSDEIHTFDRLFFVNGHTKEIALEANLNDAYQTRLFFKELSKFVKTKKVRETRLSETDYYQFAVPNEYNEITHIKWFDLVIDDGLTISHDIAFSTTLIQKNGEIQPFGKFPMWYKQPKKFPKYWEFKIKSRAYKYISNRIADRLL